MQNKRCAIHLANGTKAFTETSFAWIVSNIRSVGTTIHCVDEDGTEYEAFHLSIDIDRNVVAGSWFKI